MTDQKLGTAPCTETVPKYAKSDSSIVGTADAMREARATITAQLALRGYSLTELADGSFMVSRWSLVRPLPDLRAARDFAASVGAI